MNEIFSDKSPYQAYTIEHGFERIKIQVPLKNVQAFEEAFAAKTASGDSSKAALLEVLGSVGGSIRRKV